MEKTNSNLVYYETPLLDQIDKLQQENERLHNSINESNLAKINALLKLEKLQQENEELITRIDNTTKYVKSLSSKELAKLFHDTYEKLAPKFNYETREDTKLFDENSNNGKLMIAVCKEVLSELKESDK